MLSLKFIGRYKRAQSTMRRAIRTDGEKVVFLFSNDIFHTL